MCKACVKTQNNSCMFGLGSTAKISHCTFTNLRKAKCCYPGEVVRLNFFRGEPKIQPRLLGLLTPDDGSWPPQGRCIHCLWFQEVQVFRKLWTELPPFVLLLEPKGDLIFALGYRPWSIKKTLIIFKNTDKTAWRSATHAFNLNREGDEVEGSLVYRLS